MTRPRPNVRRARKPERERATRTLARAFGDDPIMSWMIGPGRDVSDRLSHLFGHMIGVELARPDHLVDITDGGDAVAVWHDVDQWKASPTDIIKSSPSAIRTFRHRLPRALRTLTMMEKVHPGEPHRHLAFIGVRPSHQGQGLGGALLQAMTQDCDMQGLPCYLESSNPRNDALYARHGFESRGPVALPNGAPVMTAMWRTPR